MIKESSFKIGSHNIQGKVVLAPMVSISDMPYRLITRRMGNALSWTAFVNAQEVLFGRQHRLNDRLNYDESERPIMFQLYGSDIEQMVAAAKKLLARKPDILDINLGCSVKAISARGAGAGMLRDVESVSKLILNLSHDIPIPITTKIRLGWDEKTQNYLEIVRALEESGSSLITVHARTRMQRFTAAANWDAIKQIKEIVSVPVIGNGNVKTPDDISAMISTTGCDAVMIGRAAIGNPWIFAKLDVDRVTLSERYLVIEEHLNMMNSFYGTEKAMVLFRKHAVGYLSAISLSREKRREIFSAISSTEFLRLVKNVLL